MRGTFRATSKTNAGIRSPERDVQLINLSSAQVRRQATGTDGAFQYAGLESGRYSLAVVHAPVRGVAQQAVRGAAGHPCPVSADRHETPAAPADTAALGPGRDGAGIRACTRADRGPADRARLGRAHDSGQAAAPGARTDAHQRPGHRSVHRTGGTGLGQRLAQLRSSTTSWTARPTTPRTASPGHRLPTSARFRRPSSLCR